MPSIILESTEDRKTPYCLTDDFNLNSRLNLSMLKTPHICIGVWLWKA